MFQTRFLLSLAKKETIKIDEINFNEYSPLFTSLPQPIISKETLTFEQLNQPYGYVLYRTTIPAHEKSILKINGLRDYAIIWIDGKKVGTLDRRLNEDTLNMEASSKEQTINILVENMGRINFGPYLLENYKGIIGNIELGNQALQNWEIFSLPFNHPEKTIFSTGFALLKSKDESKFITKLSFYLFMYSSDLMKQMESAMPKSAYPSINKEDIDNFKIPLPPITEQQKIVSEIEKIEAKIKVLETEIAAMPKEKEAVLKKYL